MWHLLFIYKCQIFFNASKIERVNLSKGRFTKDIPKNLPKDISKNLSEDITKNLPKDIPKVKKSIPETIKFLQRRSKN